MMKNKLLAFLLMLLPLVSFAQRSLMEQLMSTSDKMFLVVIVLLIIFFGIIFYLTLLDKKIKRLEEQTSN